MWTLILHISKLCGCLCPNISSTYKQVCFTLSMGLSALLKTELLKVLNF